MIPEYIQALQDEIQALEQIGSPYTIVRFRQQLAHSDNQHWYLFEAKYSVTILKDTPCLLELDDKGYSVHVVESEGRFITLSSYSELPKITGSVRLVQGAIALMMRLIQCLQENKDRQNPVGVRMFPSNEGLYTPKKIASFDFSTLPESNTLRQNQAIQSALTNDISYLWGLPGSGKTTVIGQIIHHLYQQNRSVLVVSHTNTAIDGALEKALKHIDVDNSLTETSCPILRIGTPAKKLPRCLLLEEQAKALNKDLSVRHIQLCEEREHLGKRQFFLWPYIPKYEWVSRTKLEEIKGLQTNISSLEEEQAQHETQRIDLLEKFSDASREYAQLTDCRILEDKLKQEKSHLDLILTTNASNLKKLQECQNHIRVAQDEIKKHDKYARMQNDEKAYFSEHHYRENLKAIQEKISTLRIDIQNLKEQQNNAETIITAYGGMSKFQKFFTSKSRIENAEKTLAEVYSLLPEKENALEQEKRLHLEISDTLRTLCYLHEQMRMVAPTKTKAVWESNLEESQAAARDLQSHIEENHRLENQCRTSILQLSKELEESKKALSLKDFYDKKIKDNHHSILRQTQEIKKLKEHRKHLLEEEQQLYCTLFSAKEPLPLDNLYETLMDQLSIIKQELTEIDSANLSQEYKDNSTKLGKTFKQIKDIEFALDDVKFKLIKDAPVVGTTLTTSYMNLYLRRRMFDTIILDEASFASIPALWCATLLAEKNVIIVGDFMQLPPIANAHTPLAKKWLGKDIFWHSGMQDIARNPACCPENFIMLNDQFRMESPIASIANLYYGEYGGIHSHDELRNDKRKAFYKWFPYPNTGYSVHLLDTKEYQAWTSRDISGSSRVNSFTASMNVAMAFHFIEKILQKLDPKTASPMQEPKVLIIAQYALHIERIKQLIELEYKHRGFPQNLNYIQAGTVHSFQGMEADIVIFDLVLDNPDAKAMLFRQETVDLEIKRMLNVAVTRARFKLFIVGNFDFCIDHAGINAFADFLKYIHRFPKENFSCYLPHMSNMKNLELATQKQIICDHVSFGDYFIAEIQQMKTGMTIYSPFFTENRLKQLLPIFKEAVAKGKRIKIVTKTLANRSADKRDDYRRWETQLRDIGVTIQYKNDMHEKLILVDSNIVWIGSLNVLSYTGRTGEIMMRYVGLDITKKHPK